MSRQVDRASTNAGKVDEDLRRITAFCQAITDWGASGRFPKSDEASRLPASALVLLRCLEQAGPMTITQLAIFVGLHASTVSTQLRPLDAAGLVRRAPDAVDRRVTSLSITAAGRTQLDQGRIEGARGWGIALNEWSPAHLRQLADLLDRARSDAFAAMERAITEHTAALTAQAGTEPDPTPARTD